ncbi:hypothetical protein [Nostoc sp.]|uniref:hypothetical protein n=1 Tax=Nostoc sp. TaxID=1180 RepID=UPI002FFC2D9C
MSKTLCVACFHVRASVFVGAASLSGEGEGVRVAVGIACVGKLLIGLLRYRCQLLLILAVACGKPLRVYAKLSFSAIFA